MVCYLLGSGWGHRAGRGDRPWCPSTWAVRSKRRPAVSNDWAQGAMSGPAADAGTAPWLRPGRPGETGPLEFRQGRWQKYLRAAPAGIPGAAVRSGGGQLHTGGLAGGQAPIPDVPDHGALADVAFTEQRLQLANIPDGLGVHGNDHITGPETGLARRARGDDRDHLDATSKAGGPRYCRRERARASPDTEVGRV